MGGELVLGPVLRYVDSVTATVWVQTAHAATVSVEVGDQSWSARTFAVHGHHYALVDVCGVQAGARHAYTVALDGVRVWPQDRPSSLALPREDVTPTVAFGSCRTSVSHDAQGHKQHGVDALRAFGMAMARNQPGAPQWPDLLLLLGDQVYADELSPEMERFIRSRRSLDEPPGAELKDYDEYAHLYAVAWGDPWLRWVLSCLPSFMIFDDHDVRDDWNTSWRWRRDMAATSWWHGRIVAALSSYWVYQHVGNLSPQERAADEIWSQIERMWDSEDAEPDVTAVLDAFAERVDATPDSYRWSYARDIDDVRIVVVDSRAARVLREGDRSMLDDEEMAWLDGQLRGDCSHLLIGTSLPFLLPNGLHYLEAWDEAVAGGSWGSAMMAVGERIRRGMDLEHWGAFSDAFQKVSALVLEVAAGRRGQPPRSITFLSGDVHHSYLAEVTGDRDSRIVQLVCSPIRNPLPKLVRAGNAFAAHRVSEFIGKPLARSASAASPLFEWETKAGPWYHNNLGILHLAEKGMVVTWWTGTVRRGDHDHPQLEPVALAELEGRSPVRTWRRRRCAGHPRR